MTDLQPNQAHTDNYLVAPLRREVPKPTLTQELACFTSSPNLPATNPKASLQVEGPRLFS